MFYQFLVFLGSWKCEMHFSLSAAFDVKAMILVKSSHFPTAPK